MQLLRKEYISPSHESVFVNFKYKGGTDSITYQYIWGPLAEYLLKFIPIWVAPNLITLNSLILITASHILFMWVPDKQNGIPVWKLIVMAVSIFIYQNLDNIDGKQARKTKTGSPLGMLFDHGSDSLASFMLALQFLKIIQMTNPNITIVGLYMFIMLVFFSALWNQYSTGFFKLGRVNPVDQGLPCMSGIALAAIIFPFQGLEQYHYFAPINVEIMTVLGVILMVLLFSMNRNILKNAIRPKQDVIQTFGLPFWTGLLLLFCHLWRPQIYYKEILFPTSYSLMFFWSRNMIQIQLYYIAEQKFKVFNRGTTIFFILHAGYLFWGEWLQLKGINANMYFWMTTLINGLLFFQFVLSVLRQGSRILKIDVLRIGYKKE